MRPNHQGAGPALQRVLLTFAKQNLSLWQGLEAMESCVLLDVCQLGVREELGGARLLAVVLSPLGDVKGVQHCS